MTSATTTGGIVGVIEEFGPLVTVRELAFAGKTSEILMVVGAGGAAWYTGGVVGSAAVATGRYLSCGSSMLDAISYARQHYPGAPWLVRHFQVHPEVYTPGHPSRRSYAARMRLQA
ncbi:hypothetical protein ASG87_08665 [Frateuria sp. Soil773]|uniref:hypothetical protein n=1 Tax=Frateuria sp. Soil773 TaxID=1736407 RepID=UPI0006F2F3E9|nr:hypothetical protein [Frateuria sp. Soil773]KRE88642.1 hypothetical protein ASG87_08665 [Frateuria sp. Soil773]